jgi:hypothetical protein
VAELWNQSRACLRERLAVYAMGGKFPRIPPNVQWP